MRQEADAARDKADLALQQATAATRQAEAAATASRADANQSRDTISNFLGRLDALPPADALKVAGVFFTPGDEKQPWAARFLRERGGWRSRVGDWKSAAGDFSQALDLEPANISSYDALAPLLVQSGEMDAFVRHCARFLSRFGGASDPARAGVVARDCLLAPAAGVDLGALAALAQRALDAATNGIPLCRNQLTSGLAAYRQGHYSEAAG